MSGKKNKIQNHKLELNKKEKQVLKGNQDKIKSFSS